MHLYQNFHCSNLQKLQIFQALGEVYQKRYSSIIFHFISLLPFPHPIRAQTLQALNHVTIIPAKGNPRALPWVPINTCYLISQRGCWWLMACSSIHFFSLPPQRLHHHCSHPSPGSESNRDWATQRVGEIYPIVQKLEFVKSKFPVINLQKRTRRCGMY